MAGESLAKLMEDFRQFRESEKANTAERYDFEQEPVFEKWNPATSQFDVFPLHAGQRIVWNATEHDVAVIAGAQSGKTSLLPWLIARELQRKGGGNALIVGPTYPLMDRQLVPSCERVWGQKLDMGEYKFGRRQFVFSKRGLAMLGVKEASVFFGFAEDPESLESLEAVVAACDEAGQSKFSREAIEAVRRRLSLARGRIFYSTTPYQFNWFKQDIHDRSKGDPNIKVVNYVSKDNPNFSEDEWDRQEKLLPKWKFDMFYRGLFTKPAGAVYECFDREHNTCKRFPIPKDWIKVAGHDFGPVHMAACFWAQNPETKVWYWYRSYLDGNKSNLEHVKEFRLRAGVTPEEDGYYAPISAWGGSLSEDTWREDFGRAGWPIEKPPIKDVDEGIARMYALLQTRKLVIFDDLTSTIEEIESYSYEIGPDGDPVVKNGKHVIENKERYHRADTGRYAATAVYAGLGERKTVADRFLSTEDDDEDVFEGLEEGPYAHLGWQ